MHVPADSIERQAKAPRRPAVEALLSSSTLPAVASDRGRDLNDEGRVVLRQPLFTRWCPCASSGTGERRSSPLPEAPDLTRCSRAPSAPLAGRRGLRCSPSCGRSTGGSSATAWRRRTSTSGAQGACQAAAWRGPAGKSRLRVAGTSTRAWNGIFLRFSPHVCARVCEKVDDLSAVVSLVVVMLVSTAHDSTLGAAGGWCRAQKTARESDSGDPILWPASSNIALMRHET